MKKLWNKLPRLFRGSVYVALSLAAAMAIYAFLGAPTTSLERQFRRAERAHMVGPGKILGTVALEADLGSYQSMLVAEDSEGVILYCYDHLRYDPPELVYREKTGDITVLCAPYPNENREQQTTAYLPVLVFADDPQAARAELELTLAVSYRGMDFEKTYRLEASREYEGFFLFRIVSHDARGLGLEGTALQRFAMISGYHSGTYSQLEIPATVRLYGEDGTLLAEKETLVRSVPALAGEEKG